MYVYNFIQNKPNKPDQKNTLKSLRIVQSISFCKYQIKVQIYRIWKQKFRFDYYNFQNVGLEKSIEMSESEIKTVYYQIINKISSIYKVYENRSIEMKQKNNKKSGEVIQKSQSQLFKNLQINLQPGLAKLLGEMQTVKSLKGQHAGIVRSCHNSIKNILKKRPFNFRVNKQIKELYDQTINAITTVRGKLSVADQTAFLCCGVDGKKEIDGVMNFFKIQAGKWEMIDTLESKGSIDNFICPQFNQNQFLFIKQKIKNSWPKQKQVKQKIIEKIITKEKQVIRQIQVGSSSPLHEANQYIYGINKQQNVLRGLQIYQIQAEKNNAQACAFLGRIYQQGALLPKNLVKSIGYYKKAMEQKHPYATFRFSLGLIKGQFNKNGQTPEDIKKGFELLNGLSNDKKSCPQALAELGYLYEHGSFNHDKEALFKVPVDLKKAIDLNERARKLFLPRAVNNLGLLYFNHKDINPNNANQKIQSQPMKAQNTKRALSYFMQAQKLGYPQAYFNLGIIHKQQKSAQKSLHYFYEGSLKGDYMSKIKFAYELMNQTSIEKEQYQDHYKLAAHWLEGVVHKLTINQQASISQSGLKKNKMEKGQALYYLGLLYEHGFGVQKSPKRSFNYFLQASELQYPTAKNKIGDCYFSGYGVQLNRQFAIGCYIQAQQLGNSDAMVNLGTIYLNGIPSIVQRNYNKAHEYFCKAMEMQNSDAMIHLSYMYRNGVGLDQDDELSKKLLEEAAKNKNSTALYMLKELGDDFNKNIFYDNLENQFFSPPKRLNITEIVPLISGIN